MDALTTAILIGLAALSTAPIAWVLYMETHEWLHRRPITARRAYRLKQRGYLEESVDLHLRDIDKQIRRAAPHRTCIEVIIYDQRDVVDEVAYRLEQRGFTTLNEPVPEAKCAGDSRPQRRLSVAWKLGR